MYALVFKKRQTAITFTKQFIHNKQNFKKIIEWLILLAPIHYSIISKHDFLFHELFQSKKLFSVNRNQKFSLAYTNCFHHVDMIKKMLIKKMEKVVSIEKKWVSLI